MGASGFVVCAQLLEREHKVAALVRRPGPEPAGCQAVRGDLSESFGWPAGVGCRLPGRAGQRWATRLPWVSGVGLSSRGCVPIGTGWEGSGRAHSICLGTQQPQS